MRNQPAARDVAVHLLADFGQRPAQTRRTSTRSESEARLFRNARRREPASRGWSPATAQVSTWRMVSEQAPALRPFISASRLPPTGAQMGIDVLSGGSFYADPLGWTLSSQVSVTNPNVICFGKPGGGKSATSKAFLLRMTDFGYRVLILGDPKDEYEPICHALGVEPFAIGHGLPARINPLDFGPLGKGWADLSRAEAQRRATVIFRRWLTLIRGLVGSQRVGERWVPFGPSEEVVARAALSQITGYTNAASTLTQPTIPVLWRALDEPSDTLIAECRYRDRRHFLDETRLIRDALGQLVFGVLGGLFDDHTTIKVDWDAPHPTS